MEIVPIEVFGVSVDVPFPTPLGVSQARLEEFSSRLCEAGTGLGFRPEQFRLKRWDELYGYELAVQFFGENGFLSRTADRVKLGVRNARTAPDWIIIRDLLRKFYDLMEFDPASLSSLSTHAHVRFPSSEDRDQWLGRFSYSPLITRPGALGYVQIVDWEKDIRVLIEQSNAVPTGGFIAWDTQFTNDQQWESFLPRIPEMMENSANLFDLGFEPLRERL